jgi:hypothetical protein
MGNVGADTVTQTSATTLPISLCRNPLPGVGGTDPETNDQIRRRAPSAFQIQERAVTMKDYRHMVTMDKRVERSVATMRWTGSWHTVFMAIEPRVGGNLSASLKADLESSMEKYRLAGQDLE